MIFASEISLDSMIFCSTENKTMVGMRTIVAQMGEGGGSLLRLVSKICSEVTDFQTRKLHSACLSDLNLNTLANYIVAVYFLPERFEQRATYTVYC